MAKRCRKLADRRKDRNHQVMARLVADHGVIITEMLSIPNMMASAAGTDEKPGKRVRQKAGLNRAILDATPGSFLSFLAAESGRGCLRVDPARHRASIGPSQTDPCQRRRSAEKAPVRSATHRPAGRPGDPRDADRAAALGDAGRGPEAQRSGTGLGRETGNFRQSGLSCSAEESTSSAHALPVIRTELNSAQAILGNLPGGAAALA